MNIEERGCWEPVDTDLTSMVYNQQGELVGIERSKRKIGATIVDPVKFKAGLKLHNPPMEPWMAFTVGLVIGASAMFSLGGLLWLFA